MSRLFSCDRRAEMRQRRLIYFCIMRQNIEDVQSLLNDVGSIAEVQTPTILEMVEKGTSETMHSAIIGFLLNPMAHEAGRECLKEFINLFPEGSLGRFNPDNVFEVAVEKDLGPVSINERPTGGRLDVYLEDTDGNVLVIENKIYAGDSECQLLRYHNSLTDSGKAHSLIYLSLNGNKPSDWSLGEGNNHVDIPLSTDYVKVLSYSDIQKWISKIEAYCSPEMRSNIQQYSRLLSNMFMENQISEKVLSSGNSYRAAIEIANSLEDARMNLKRDFMEHLKNKLTELWKPEGNYLIEEYDSQGNAKLVGLTVVSKKSDLRFDVVIDWRLYITCNLSSPDILQHGTWDYVGGKNAYDFHECSKLVAEYLSSENDKQVVAGCAAKQIADIIYRIEGRQ